MSAGKSGQQTQAENITGQRGASQVSAQNQATGALGNQNQALGTAQGTLGQFEGPIQQSPFYKNLLNTGIEGTSQAYDNARSNLMARGNMAGFGYQQPLVQGAGGQLGQQEATAMAALPRQAALAATGPALQAAGQTAGLGSQYGQQGLGLGNQALGWGQQQLSANQQAAGLQQQRNQANSALFSALLGVGMAPLTGGLSGLAGLGPDMGQLGDLPTFEW